MKIAKRILFIFLLHLVLISSCKESPTLSTENSLDPESENYKITPPRNLIAEITETKVELSWEPSSSEAFDGYIVYYSFSDTNSFKAIAELDTDEISFNHTPTGNPITLFYKVTAFYDQNDRRIFSASTSLEQTQQIFSISAYQKDNLEVEISIDHNFYSFSEFSIEQRIGSSSSFEPLKTFSTASNTTIIKYNELPSDEVTYRVFVENEFNKTNTFETLAYGYFEAPQDLTITRDQGSEVEIEWSNNSDGVDEYLLYDGYEILSNTEEGLRPEPLLRVSGDKNSLTLSDLDAEERYYFVLQTRKGGFYSSFDTGFELISAFPNSFELSTPIVLDGLELISGEVSSDGNYFTFDVSNDRQYVYNAESLVQTYKYEPENSYTTSTIVEAAEKIYFSELRSQNNSGVVLLKNIFNNTISKTIPSINPGGYIQEISFIDNTSIAIVYSSMVNAEEEIHTVALYDFGIDEYIKTLITDTNRNYFKSASSNKSILIYDVFNSMLKRFSLSDYSFINDISLVDKIDSEIIFFESETVPDSIEGNSDYFNFKVQFSEVFRMDMENPVKENLNFDLGLRNTIYQFGSSKNGSLKCFNNIDSIQCFSFEFFEAFTLDPTDDIAGFLLSHNDEFILIFTENDIQKYRIKKEWTLINYEGEPY